MDKLKCLSKYCQCDLIFLYAILHDDVYAIFDNVLSR